MKTFNKLLLLIAFISIFTIVFHFPMPGVADQGDFQRVMSVTGIGELINNSGYHWFKYVTPEYKIAPLSFARLLGVIPTTSMIYPIALVRAISIVLGIKYFNTKILALVYAVMYSFALYICLKYINFEKKSTYFFFTVLSLFILMDGNYLVWFNSLYGESMMIIGLLLFASSILYISINVETITFTKLLFPFASAFLFLGAKMQCFSALPIIVFFIIRLAFLRRPHLKSINISQPILLATLLLIFYVGGIYIQINSTCGIDTQYNSVFYGILKDSKTPAEDLAVLGLPPDMALEAGKHAYLPKEDYVKYTPGSSFTIDEFNEKISNLTLLKFYLLNPHRFIRGMAYTASQSFNTEGFLGKYEKSDIAEYTYKLNRFTLWSHFRNSYMPKNLIFLALFYLLVISISFIEYRRKKGDTSWRLRIELLWVIILIGLLQFPMPYIGNGQADTGKQLFLFNYTFDIVFLVACTWLFNKLIGLNYKKSSSIK